MDLIPNFTERQRIFRSRTEQLTATTSDVQITCFGTSIWDETLYKAWSAVAYSLVPNIDRLHDALHKLCQLCNADEIVLFEQVTFLVISNAENSALERQHHDVHRHEKMSNIIKQFKLCCNTMKVSFRSIQVHNTYYSAYMDIFTPTTYIMVICSEPKLTTYGIQINIAAARRIFDNIMSSIE
uniref:Ras-related GTP-binding protein A n=1 Tax=Lygus hesperus TaxID=30085 RepID=A0A0A9ZF25_LYGHE